MIIVIMFALVFAFTIGIVFTRNTDLVLWAQIGAMWVLIGISAALELRL